MFPIEVCPSIYWVGVNDRHTERFEGLWPIYDEGVSYNSYLIKDEKNAIIDLVSKMSAEELIAHLSTILDPAKLDYIIINHMEPDHSGALKTMLQLAPKVKLIGSAKTISMLESFYGITENVVAVNDGEELDLGKHTLKFVSTPFVHWPETMMTYETTQKILFSCDGFGGYGALNGSIFDDESVPLAWYKEQALRYFVNIVATFSKPVRTAIAKLESVPIAVVAPSHGLIWKNHPQRIIDLYNKWSEYATEPTPIGITLLYASMYGNTEKMMEVVAQGVEKTGVPLTVINVAKTPVSYILASLWTKKGVLVGAPTYEGGLFPDMSNALAMAARKHVFYKTAAGFGSHGWSGGGQRELEQTAIALKWDFKGSFEFTGAPSAEDLAQGREFGTSFARNLQSAA